MTSEAILLLFLTILAIFILLLSDLGCREPVVDRGVFAGAELRDVRADGRSVRPSVAGRTGKLIFIFLINTTK